MILSGSLTHHFYINSDFFIEKFYTGFIIVLMTMIEAGIKFVVQQGDLWL